MGQAELEAQYKRNLEVLKKQYEEQVGKAYAEVVGSLEQEEDEGYLEGTLRLARDKDKKNEDVEGEVI